MAAPTTSSLQLSCSATNTIAALNAMDVHLQELGLYEGEKVSDTLASSDNFNINEYANAANCTETIATNDINVLQDNATAPTCNVNSVIKEIDSSTMHIQRDETKDHQLANACNSAEKTIESDLHTLAQKATKVKRYSTTLHAIHAKGTNILQQRQSLVHTSNTMSQAYSEKHICDVIAEANYYLSEEMGRSTAAFVANVQSKKAVLECKERITYLSHIAALQRDNDLYSATALITTLGSTQKAAAAATAATNNTAACAHSLSKSNRTCSLILSDTEERETLENNTRMQRPSALTLTTSSSSGSAKVRNQISAGVKNVGVDRNVIEFCRWLVAGIVSVAIEVSDNRFLPVADMYNKPVRRITQDLSVSYWNKLIKEHLSLPSAISSSSPTLLAEAKPESLPHPSPESQKEPKQEESVQQNTSQITIAQTHNSEDFKCMPELPTRETNIKETGHVQELQLSNSQEAINANTPLQEQKEIELSENFLPSANKVVKETADSVQEKAVLQDAHTVKKESVDEDTLYAHEVHDALEFMANEALASDNILHNEAIDQVRVLLQHNLACCQANAIEEWRTHIQSSSNNNSNKLRKCIVDEEHINDALTVPAGWFVFGDRLSGAHLLRHLIETESENEINNQLDLLLAKSTAAQKVDDDDDDDNNKANKLLNSLEYEVKRRYLTPKLLLQGNSEILRALFTSIMSMAANTNSSPGVAMTSGANTSNINTNMGNTNATISTTTVAVAAANTSMSTSSFAGVHGSLSFASANNPGKANHSLNTKVMRGPASFHGKGGSVGVGGGNNYYSSSGGSTSGGSTGIGSYAFGSTVNSSSFYYRSLASVIEILMNHEDVYYDTQRCVGNNETESATREHDNNNNEMSTRNDEASHGSTSMSRLYQRTSNHDEHSCDTNKKSSNNNSTSHHDSEAALHVYNIVADLLAKELICIYIRNIHTLSPLSVPECVMHEIDKPTHDRVSAKDCNAGAGPVTTATTTTMSLPSSVTSTSSYSRASQTLPAVPSSRKSSRNHGNELPTSTHDVNSSTSNNSEATHDMHNKTTTPTPISNVSDNITNLEEHHNECNKKTRLESLIMVDFPRSVNFHSALQHALVKRMNEMEVKIAGALQSAIQAEEEQAEFEANANITAANDRRGKRNKLSSANERTLQRPSSGMKTTLNEHATLISSQNNQSRHNTMETQTSNSINSDISMPNGSHNIKGSNVGAGSGNSGINNIITTTTTTTNATAAGMESNHNNNEGSHTNEHDIRAAQLRQISIAAYPPLLVGGLFLSYDIVDRFNRLQELYLCASNSNGDTNLERNKLNELRKVNSSKELQRILERTYHNILCPESFQIKKEVSNIHANPVMPNRALSMTRRSVVYQSGSALQSNTNTSSSNSGSSNNMLEMSTRKSTMLSAPHDNTTGSTLLNHNTTSTNTTPLSTLSNSSTCNTRKEFLADTWDVNTFRAVVTQQHHAVDTWRCAWEQCVNTDMMHNFIKYHTCTDTHDGHVHHEAVAPLTNSQEEPSASSTAAVMAGNNLHKTTHPIKSTARDGKAQSNDKHTRDNKNRLEKNLLAKIIGTQSSLLSKKTTCSLEEKSNTLHMNEMSGSVNNEKMINYPRVVFMSHVIDCSNILQVYADKKKCSHISKDDGYEQQLRVIAFIERKLEQTTMFTNINIENEKCCTSNTTKEATPMESVGNRARENVNAPILLLSPPSLTINDYRLTPDALKEMLSINNKYTSQINKIDVICNHKSRACSKTSEDEVKLSNMNTNTQSLNEVKSLHIACLESEMKYERVFFIYLLQILTLLQRKAFPLSLWDKSAEVFNATLFYTSIDGNFESILEELEYLTIQTRHALLCYGIQWMYNALEVTRRVMLRAVSTSKMLSNCVLQEEIRLKNHDSPDETNEYENINNSNTNNNNNKNEQDNYKQSLSFASSLNIVSLATELVKEMQSCTSSHSCNTIMSNIKCKLENEIKENLSVMSACSDVGNSAVITETIAKMVVQQVWSGAPLLLRTINVLHLFMSAFRQAEQSANNWLKRMYNEVLTIKPVNDVRNNRNNRNPPGNEEEKEEQTELEAIRTYIAKLRPGSMNDIFTKGIESLHYSKEEDEITATTTTTTTTTTAASYVSSRMIDLDTLLVKFTLSNFCLYNSPHLSCGAFVRCVLLSELPLLALLSSNSSKVASAVTAPTTITPLSSEYISHLHTIENYCVDMEWNNLTVLPDLHEMICSCAHNFTLFTSQHTLLPKDKLPVHTVQELLNSVFHNVCKSQTLSDECFCEQSEQFFTRQCSADRTVNARLLLWNLVLSRLCYTNSDINSKRKLLCANDCFSLENFCNNINNNSSKSTSNVKVKLTNEQRRYMYNKYNYKAKEFMLINSSATHNLRQALSHIKLTHDVVPSENGVINIKLLDFVEVIPEALRYILQCSFAHNASLQLPLVDRVSIDVLLQVATFTAPTWLGRVERLFHAIAALKQHERHTSCSDVDKLALTADEIVFYFEAISDMLGVDTKVARHSKITLADDVRLLFSIEHVNDGLSLSKFMSSHWAQTLINSRFRC